MSDIMYVLHYTRAPYLVKWLVTHQGPAAGLRHNVVMAAANLVYGSSSGLLYR